MTAETQQPPSPSEIQVGISITFPPFPVSGKETPEGRRARALDPALLRALAAGPERVVRTPVAITNAVVEEEVDFSFATFEGQVSFAGTRFEKFVNLEGARFKRHADFSRCVFAGGVSLRAATADYDLFLLDARVRDGRFTGLTVGRRFDATRARFKVRAEVDAQFGHARLRQAIFQDATFTCKAWFVGMRVDLEMDLRGAWFKRRAEFHGLSTGGRLGATVSGTERRPTRFARHISFNRAAIGGSAEFQGAVFGRAATFMGTTFGDQALFERAKFKRAVTFTDARFHRDAWFRGATFRGDAAWRGARVHGDLRLDDATFRAGAVFDHASIGGEAVFTGAWFLAGLSLAHAAVTGPAHFHASPERQTTVEGAASFSWATFGSYANLRGVEFRGDTSFVRTRFNDSVGFEASDDAPATRFRGAVTFWGARVEDTLGFRGVEFAGAATFDELSVGRRACWGVEGMESPTRFRQAATFADARFDGELDLSGVVFGADADFSGIVVNGEACFKGCTFAKRAVFAGARLRDVHFRGTLTADAPADGAQFGGTVVLRRAEYGRILVAYRELLDQMEPESNQPYLQLERALRSMGEVTAADEVFLRMHREGTRRLRAHDRPRYWLDRAYGMLAGYGLYPGRLGYVSLAVLIVGALVFRIPSAVVPADPPAGIAPAPATLSWGQAVGVSLHQFFPLEIPSGAAWQPSDERMRLGRVSVPVAFRSYATLHRLFGYVLVPLAVALLTGFLQQKRDREK